MEQTDNTTGFPWDREVTFDYRNAEPGTRVRHSRTGYTGTFVRASRHHHNGAIVDWDDRGFGVQRDNVVGAAYELERE